MRKLLSLIATFLIMLVMYFVIMQIASEILKLVI